MAQNMKTVIFPGSFNPFTRGHADVVDRALKLFDRVVVAVGYNAQKVEAVGVVPGDVAQRVDAIARLYVDDERVEVISYNGLTIDAARKCGACALLRSVRSIKDYEYELQMADVNRQLSGIETVVLFARPELSSISSSVVRELQQFGCDVSQFLA